MNYTIKQRKDIQESFGDYKYEIFDKNHLIAIYWHDYRGDDHGIDFINININEFPFNKMSEFLIGGGKEPIDLSDSAKKFINKTLTIK